MAESAAILCLAVCDCDVSNIVALCGKREHYVISQLFSAMFRCVVDNRVSLGIVDWVVVKWV